MELLKTLMGVLCRNSKLSILFTGGIIQVKTTLSRVFRCLEKGMLHDDYKHATFELENLTTKYDNKFTIRPI